MRLPSAAVHGLARRLRVGDAAGHELDESVPEGGLADVEHPHAGARGAEGVDRGTAQHPHPPVTSITTPSDPAGDRRIPGELVGVGTPAGGRRLTPRRVRCGALTIALVTFGMVLPGHLAARAEVSPSGSGPGTRTLLVADLKGLTHDEQIVFTVLQGIVNRTSARVYYVGLFGGQDYITDPTGELWLRGPTTFAGYWRRPELTARAYRGGWMRTGDLVRIRDGRVYHEGRLDDLGYG